MPSVTVNVPVDNEEDEGEVGDDKDLGVIDMVFLCWHRASSRDSTCVMGYSKPRCTTCAEMKANDAKGTNGA